MSERHCVYYDSGNGYAALLAAALRLQLLPSDVLPAAERVANVLRDCARREPSGDVHRLGEHRGETVYWCGLGRSTTVVIRTWRHFLHLYGQPQEAFRFYQVPLPTSRRWKRGLKAIGTQGRQEKGRRLLAEAAVREYAVFLTVLLTDWQEGERTCM